LPADLAAAICQLVSDVGLGLTFITQEIACGEVPERLIGLVSKTSMGLRSIEGSNPSPSANKPHTVNITRARTECDRSTRR
jgi:hypothetical protein